MSNTDVRYFSSQSEDFWNWFGPRLDAKAQAEAEAVEVTPEVTKATPVVPRRAPRPIEGQTFAPLPESRSLRLTAAEARYLGDEHLTKGEVKALMNNRSGVCG